jgi:hypothetical protein
MKHFLHIAMFAATCGVVGCGTSEYTRLHPQADPREAAFVSFLQEDGHVTPSQIQTYLASNNIANSVSRNTWVGVDSWRIGDWGSWTARYTGRRKQLDGESFIIPGDINGMINTPRNATDPITIDTKNASMHNYYDSIRQDSREYEIRFDRTNDTAKTTEQVMRGNRR